MYQVLIVDDEKSVLSLLQNTINWEMLGLSLIGSATDGAQALEILQTNLVDIVITDIRMQKMSGLELSQILYQKYPHIKIIIMSGYAEFSYAQKALRYGALGYCLKPIEPEDLTQLLLKAIGKLHSENNIVTDDNILESIYTNDNDSISKYLTHHGLQPDCLYLTVTTGFKPLTNASYSGVCIRLSSTQWTYITNEKIHPNVLSNLKDTFEGCGFLPSSITLSELHHAISKCQRYAYQYYISPELIICHGHDDQISIPFLNELMAQISIPNINGVINLLKKFQLPEYHQLFSIKGALQIYNAIRYSGFLGEDENFPEHYHHLVQQFQSFHNELDYLIRQLSQGRNSKIPDQVISNSSLLEILVYINANYGKDISLRQVAEKFNFNPSYLSQAFKKETGETFTKYLTTLRINKAKDILSSTEESIETVSNKVGYGDYFYFLKTFKKVTGMTPNQFRFGLNQS